jgi:uncharacterized protein YcfL
MPIMKKLIPVFALVLAAAAGCKSIDPPARGRADVTDHRRVFFSKQEGEKLREQTAILSENISRDQFGLVTAIVPIRSATSKTLYLEYQYEFFDSNGRRVEGPFSWIPVTLEAGSPATIQFTSTSTQADDYRLTIRKAR